MIEKTLNPKSLIPTDNPRNLKTITDLIPLFVLGKERDIKPIIVLPARRFGKEKYFVCDGNHRAAASYICQKPINGKVITDFRDLEDIELYGEILEKVGGIKRLRELEDICYTSASLKHMIGKNGWEEYLRSIAGFQIEYD